MNAPECIFVDDSSSDEEEVTQKPNGPLHPQQSAVEEILEILPHTDRNLAVETLRQCHGNVEQAVSQLLDSSTIQKRAESTKRSLFVLHDKAADDAKRPRSSDYHLTKDAAVGGDFDHSHTNLSWQWKQAYNQTAPGSFYVDPDFRPESSSIDGRVRALDSSSSNGTSSTTLTIKCHCGVLARPLSVQSEGPDYGRFYLACGRKGMMKRRAPVVVERRTSPVKEKPLTDTTTTATIRNPYAKNNKSTDPVATTTKKTPSTPPQRQSCDFFQWDRNGTYGALVQDAYAMGRFQRIQWKHFGLTTSHVLCNTNTTNKSKSHSIQQGSIGNCWFLSALAVVAEQPYLIDKVLGHHQNALNDRGVYQVNLCLDGKWTPVIVDSYIPIIEKDLLGGGKRSKQSTNASPQKWKATPPKQQQTTLCRSGSAAVVNYRTAFCAMPDKQLWPALIEKAYAKAHGSYANLSGGFIAEGLTDLTGAPTETILLNDSAMMNHDELWARLLSFYQAGFVMGVATLRGGDGLVGGHAYSILDVIEVSDLMIGEQAKVTDFFGATKTSSVSKTIRDVDKESRRQTIRLVRIRNPWGKREWKGEWSADSDRWTKALRSRLGKFSYAKGDGTFFMAFHDMIQRFHHMDVAKTRKGWVFSSADGLFRQFKDPMNSSQFAYQLVASKRTWAFISLVQPKKRSNTSWKYYYCDISLVVMRRKHATNEWICDTVILAGVKRSISVELFLDPGTFEYLCVPFSCVATKCEGFTFRLTAYSANAIELRRVSPPQAIEILPVLHKDLLSRTHKLFYPVAPTSVLCCIHGEGCLYFLAVNGSADSYLSVKLAVDIKTGVQVVYGKETETYDIAPSSQKILVVLSGSGKFSTATELSFRYMSSLVERHSNLPSSEIQPQAQSSAPTLQSTIPITISGDLLVSNIDSAHIQCKGMDTVDTYLWISQLGATKVTLL